MALIPALPKLLNSKIYKTGQTRGADDDVIFQNRVARNSTVLIPYKHFEVWKKAPGKNGIYENGFIVLIKPEDYFKNKNIENDLKLKGLEVGKNALIFYETREQWEENNPDSLSFHPASSRKEPLNGTYVARVPSTPAEEDEKILRGFNTSGKKGAGVRVYEYASKEMNAMCRIQLEYLYWCCKDSMEVLKKNGMRAEKIEVRKLFNELASNQYNLSDKDKLISLRILDSEGHTICPLCLLKLSASGFFNRMLQAEGRDVPDLTVTEINLFHIQELRLGEFNHRVYNLGWGHHHCNTVTKDSGIIPTLKWMSEVVNLNIKKGYKF
jgi:BstXI restriction endonuclease